MGLKEKINIKASGIFLYGLTPPKLKNGSEKISRTAEKQMARIRGLKVDGLILYDIHDEKDRNKEERTFPFLETVDPQVYSEEYLSSLDIPRIIYRCVGKYEVGVFKNWLDDSSKRDNHSVFVGAASRNQKIKLKLTDAYDLFQDKESPLTLGGVCIPERHAIKHDEHLRTVEKQKKGCTFFVSQAVYNLENAKNFLSDYYYYCIKEEIDMVPIIFTLSPCGSEKTLNFLKWLGINISKWLENDILNDRNPVMRSVNILAKHFQDLWDFAKEKNIPIGCNIESISVAKKEIDASVVLAENIRKIMD